MLAKVDILKNNRDDANYDKSHRLELFKCLHIIILRRKPN